MWWVTLIPFFKGGSRVMVRWGGLPDAMWQVRARECRKWNEEVLGPVFCLPVSCILNLGRRLYVQTVLRQRSLSARVQSLDYHSDEVRKKCFIIALFSPSCTFTFLSILSLGKDCFVETWRLFALACLAILPFCARGEQNTQTESLVYIGKVSGILSRL